MYNVRTIFAFVCNMYIEEKTIKWMNKWKESVLALFMFEKRRVKALKCITRCFLRENLSFSLYCTQKAHFGLDRGVVLAFLWFLHNCLHPFHIKTRNIPSLTCFKCNSVQYLYLKDNIPSQKMLFSKACAIILDKKGKFYSINHDFSLKYNN